LLLLPLMAVRAGGQTDSVLLSIQVEGPSYDWGCVASSPYCDQTVSCSGHISRTMTLSAMSSWRNDTLIAFPITLVRDTINHEIKYLAVSFFGGAPQCWSATLGPYYNYCSDFFTNIPYTSDSLSNIHVDCDHYLGASQATCELDVMAECRDALYGSANWSGPVDDSICLTIAPMPKASVDGDVGSRGSLFIFLPIGITLNAKASRRLMIFNALGRIVLSTNVGAGSGTLAISYQSLPPGCYFARLGDEVAKFVVPPR
jgi:hypothetical protein